MTQKSLNKSILTLPVVIACLLSITACSHPHVVTRDVPCEPPSSLLTYCERLPDWRAKLTEAPTKLDAIIMHDHDRKLYNACALKQEQLSDFVVEQCSGSL